VLEADCQRRDPKQASGGARRHSRPRAGLFRSGGRHHLVMVGGIIPLQRATSSRYDGRLEQESAATGLSSTPGHQQLFAEEQHSLHSPLLKLASGWSVNPSHANSGHAVFTSLTSSSMVRSMAIRSLARFLISGSRRDRTACLTLMRFADSYWYLHTQHRSAWSQELDVRPYAETF
jgi:hypothetical protein